MAKTNGLGWNKNYIRHNSMVTNTLHDWLADWHYESLDNWCTQQGAKVDGMLDQTRHGKSNSDSVDDEKRTIPVCPGSWKSYHNNSTWISRIIVLKNSYWVFDRMVDNVLDLQKPNSQLLYGGASLQQEGNWKVHQIDCFYWLHLIPVASQKITSQTALDYITACHWKQTYGR